MWLISQNTYTVTCHIIVIKGILQLLHWYLGHMYIVMDPCACSTLCIETSILLCDNVCNNQQLC